MFNYFNNFPGKNTKKTIAQVAEVRRIWSPCQCTSGSAEGREKGRKKDGLEGTGGKTAAVLFRQVPPALRSFKALRGVDVDTSERDRVTRLG
jgi:hypothetical protein